MKKVYIQPEVKEVKLNPMQILAGSIEGADGWTFGDSDNVDDTNEGDGGDAL